MKKLMLTLVLMVYALWGMSQVTLSVTNTHSSGSGSFQAALDSAENVISGSVLIEFDTVVNGTISATGGSFDVPVTILGSGREKVSIQSAEFNFFDSASISNLTFSESYLRSIGEVTNNPLLRLNNLVVEDYSSTQQVWSAIDVSNGSIEMDSCLVQRNSSIESGGSLKVVGTPAASNVLIRNSIFRENSSMQQGGAIYIRDSHIEIDHSVIEENFLWESIYGDDGVYRGAGICVMGQSSILSITRSRIRDNTIGIFMTVPGEVAGGGLYIQGAFSLNECLISGNEIQTGNGQPYTLSGGGLAFFSTVNEPNTVTNSSIIGNVNNYGFGGGIYGRGPLSISSSTISGNSSWESSAILCSKGEFQLNFCTITANHTEVYAGGSAIRIVGSIVEDPFSVGIRNSILVGNTGEDSTGYAEDIVFENNFLFVEFTYNMLSSGGPNAINGVNILTTDSTLWGLEPLGYNGGFTPTHALLETSLAVNAADSTITFGQDQRGEERVQGGRADMGAFESSWGTLPPNDTEPPTPPELSIADLSDSTVFLTWTASTDDVGVTGYEVYQDSLLVGATLDLEWMIEGLVPCTTYGFYVVAKDSAGNQTQSNMVAVYTDTTPPEVPVLENYVTCQLVRLPTPYAFDLCDGDSIPGRSARFLKKEPGTYPVEWVFSDSNGNSSVAIQQVIITGEPIPAFSVPASTCIGDSVYFTDLSTYVSPASSYLWDFGDGTTSTQVGDVSHVYSSDSVGLYEVRLTITNGECTADTTALYVPERLPELTLEIENEISAPGAMDGAIDLSVFGKGTFEYLWNNGATTEDISDLGSGTYSVLVTNQVGCSAEGSIVLEEPEGGCFAMEVVDYRFGSKKNGRKLSKRRTDPSMALGAPQENDTYNFVALGFGGSITLQLESDLYDDGTFQPDFVIVETSHGRADQMCYSEGARSYPEMAFVEVSADNSTWYSLPNAMCRTSFVNISPAVEKGLPFVRYVRITDASNRSWFRGNADGFDVDGLITCRSEVLNAFDRLNDARTTARGAFNPAFFNKAPDEEEELRFSTYPNPIIGSALTIRFTLENEKRGVVRVLDLMGKEVLNELYQVEPGLNQFTVDVSELTSGVYVLQVQMEGELTETRRIMKQ